MAAKFVNFSLNHGFFSWLAADRRIWLISGPRSSKLRLTDRPATLKHIECRRGGGIHWPQTAFARTRTGLPWGNHWTRGLYWEPSAWQVVNHEVLHRSEASVNLPLFTYRSISPESEQT